MTDTTVAPAIPPLGVGTLIGDSFRILFKHIGPVLVMGTIPSLLGLLVSGAVIGFDATLGLEDADVTGVSTTGAEIFTSLVDMVVYSVTAAFMVQLAYDAKLQRPIRIGRYFGPALGALVPIIILGLAVGILASIAAIALLLPGLWVYAVFSVMEPAVVIERIGFRGLSRSSELTREYRWPIAGALVLVWICAIALIFAAAFAGIFLLTHTGKVPAVIFFAVLTGLGTSLISILVALVYARLREIKEGIGVDQIAAVFD